MSNIAPHNLSHIRRQKDLTSHEAWSKIESYFQQIFEKHAQTISADLNSIVYASGTDLREHIQKMDEKREELALAGGNRVIPFTKT